MSSLKNYFLAARPKTLMIAVSVWLTGWVLSTTLWGQAHHAYTFDRNLHIEWTLSVTLWEQTHFFLNIIILLCMLLLQTAVNYFNDVLDFKRNKDTTERLGPPRMVQSQKIKASSLTSTAYAVLFLALCLGGYLVIKGGVFILFIGLTALGMTYFYSAPPIALADRGLSEIFVFLFFGVLAVGGIYHLNFMQSIINYNISSGLSFVEEILVTMIYFSFSFLLHFMEEAELMEKTTAVLIAGSQMGFLSVSPLIINHLRDHQEDQKSGKKTWVVRKGRNFGRIQWAGCIVLSYLLGIYWLWEGSYFKAGILPLLVLPLYIYLFTKIILEKPSKKYNTFLALNSIGQFFFSIALCLGWMFKS